MDFIFREHAGSGHTYKYKLPEFFTPRGFGAVDTNPIVGVPTRRNPPECCEYNPHVVKGLTSACDEVGPNGPQIFGTGKNLPDPKIAELKTDKPIIMKGAKPDDTPDVEPKKPSQPQDFSTPEMNNFTDFFRNFQTFMKNYTQTTNLLDTNHGQQQQQQQQQQQKRYPSRKRKSDGDLPKSRHRLQKIKIKTFPKNR